MTTTPTEAQYETYQSLLRAKYEMDWVLSAVLAKFKATPNETELAAATAVMALYVAKETELAAAAKVCGIAHGKVG